MLLMLFSSDYKKLQSIAFKATTELHLEDLCTLSERFGFHSDSVTSAGTLAEQQQIGPSGSLALSL